MSGDEIGKAGIDDADRSDGAARAGAGKGIVPFAIKALIVAAIFYGSVVLVTDYFIGAVQDSFRHVGGAGFWGNIERQLDEAAAPDSDLPPEKKQKIIHDIRVIVARWLPLIEAAQEAASKPAAGGVTAPAATPAAH